MSKYSDHKHSFKVMGLWVWKKKRKKLVWKNIERKVKLKFTECFYSKTAIILFKVVGAKQYKQDL